MFAGEAIVDVDGFPVLIHFRSGDPAMPLVVFVPGAGHLGRVAYGTPNTASDDFLAHWIEETGHPFLAVSAPIEHPVFSEVYPALSSRDWGRLVAATARGVVDENGLSDRIVCVGWSAAGNMCWPVTTSAADHDLRVALFIALSSNPPMPGISPQYTEILLKAHCDNGMADVAGLMPFFRAALGVQNSLAGHEIISGSEYRDAFLGNFPVNTVATPVRFRESGFVVDVAEATRDMGTFEFRGFPPVGVITHDSATDDQHSMKDVSQWSVYVAQVLYAEYRQLLGSDVADETVWARVRDLVRQAPQRMHREVHGGHLCFIGKDGARAVANSIVDLIAESNEQRTELRAALSH